MPPRKGDTGIRTLFDTDYPMALVGKANEMKEKGSLPRETLRNPIAKMSMRASPVATLNMMLDWVL